MTMTAPKLRMQMLHGFATLWRIYRGRLWPNLVQMPQANHPIVFKVKMLLYEICKAHSRLLIQVFGASALEKKTRSVGPSTISTAIRSSRAETWIGV
jgi:hypothetical protein